ncbi:hypothetical protein COLO4_05429 [Corchorus olitorius]|uniref:Uncharacterized protein n=1 Tax=Corchorus olitorius TaxID=93759 RepID=A0A1R3KQV9_9ROSI|nr:hypothetical protein COLO4_05429 [Corchorus olitorius]
MSVNRHDHWPTTRGRDVEQAKNRQPVLKLKAAMDKGSISDFQGDNEGLIAIDKAQNMERNQSCDSQDKSMEKDSNLEGSTVDKSIANQLVADGEEDVVMVEDQAKKDDKNFEFKANNPSNIGGGSQNNKKWKRTTRSNSRMEEGQKIRGEKVTGKKREGSKGTMVGAGKKSREDGELNSDSISDFNTPHSAEEMQHKARQSSKKFDNFWTRHEDFRRVVVDSWKKGEANNLQAITAKLQECSNCFAAWNKSVYGSLGIKLDMIRKEIATFYDSGRAGKNPDRLNALLLELT